MAMRLGNVSPSLRFRAFSVDSRDFLGSKPEPGANHTTQLNPVHTIARRRRTEASPGVQLSGFPRLGLVCVVLPTGRCSSRGPGLAMRRSARWLAPQRIITGASPGKVRRPGAGQSAPQDSGGKFPRGSFLACRQEGSRKPCSRSSGLEFEQTANELRSSRVARASCTSPSVFPLRVV